MQNSMVQHAPNPSFSVVAPPVPQVKHFDLKQWTIVVDRSKKKFLKLIGEREPSYKDVAKTVINRNPVNVLEKIAFVVLVIGFVFTSFKTSAAALPYAKTVLEHMSHGATIDPNIVNAFIIVSAIFFCALATPALIYFKLLDHTPRIQQQKRDTAIQFKHEWFKSFNGFFRNVVSAFGVFSLDYITPRLPAFFTYAVLGWLIALGYLGGGNIFEMFLPIIAEIGLAGLVATVIEKQEAYRSLVWDKHAPMVAAWKKRVDNFMEDKDFLKIIALEIRDDLIKLKDRQGKQPNLWLEAADPVVLDQVMIDEFRRFTGNNHFADRVAKLDYMQEAKAEATQAANAARKPPNNAAAWTADTLFRDLQMRSIVGEYTEAMLLKDYAEGYEVRKAWRGGARERYQKEVLQVA